MFGTVHSQGQVLSLRLPPTKISDTLQLHRSKLRQPASIRHSPNTARLSIPTSITVPPHSGYRALFQSASELRCIPASAYPNAR